MKLRPNYISLPLLFFLLIFFVFVFKFVKIIVNPKLEISSPQASVVFEKEIVLKGKTDPQNELMINGEKITLRENGQFERKAILKEGLNEFNLEVKNFWGVRKNKRLKVIYQSK